MDRNEQENSTAYALPEHNLLRIVKKEFPKATVTVHGGLGGLRFELGDSKCIIIEDQRYMGVSGKVGYDNLESGKPYLATYGAFQKRCQELEDSIIPELEVHGSDPEKTLTELMNLYEQQKKETK